MGRELAMSDRAVIGILCGGAGMVALVLVMVLPSLLAPPPVMSLEGTGGRRVETTMPVFRMPSAALREPEIRPARPFRPAPAKVAGGSSYHEGGMAPDRAALADADC